MDSLQFLPLEVESKCLFCAGDVENGRKVKARERDVHFFSFFPSFERGITGIYLN